MTKMETVESEKALIIGGASRTNADRSGLQP
jgi:hypothetical protein